MIATNTALKVIAFLLVLSIGFAVATGVSWVLMPSDVLTNSDFKLKLEYAFPPTSQVDSQGHALTAAQPFQPGTDLVFSSSMCKVRKIYGVWSRELVDGSIWTLSDTQSGLPDGCGVRFIGQTIPHGIPDGTYKLRIVVRYQINPIKTSTYVFTSEPFEVRR